MRETIPPKLRLEERMVRIIYISNGALDCGQTMEDIVKRRKPQAIFNLFNGRLSSLVDESRVLCMDRRIFDQDGNLPLEGLKNSPTHDVYFADLNQAYSFLMNYRDLKLKNIEYY